MRRQSIRKGITLLSGVIRESKISSLLATLDRLNALISREKSFVRFCRVQKNRLQRVKTIRRICRRDARCFPARTPRRFFSRRYGVAGNGVVNLTRRWNLSERTTLPKNRSMKRSGETVFSDGSALVDDFSETKTKRAKHNKEQLR